MDPLPGLYKVSLNEYVRPTRGLELPTQTFRSTSTIKAFQTKKKNDHK